LSTLIVFPALFRTSCRFLLSPFGSFLVTFYLRQHRCGSLYVSYWAHSSLGCRGDYPALAGYLLSVCLWLGGSIICYSLALSMGSSMSRGGALCVAFHYAWAAVHMESGFRLVAFLIHLGSRQLRRLVWSLLFSMASLAFLEYLGVSGHVGSSSGFISCDLL
jgi:hypothetical protein